MEYLYDMREKLCRELKEIAHKEEMGAGDLELVHKLTDTIKNIDKIRMLEQGEYSRDYSRDYDRESSYRRRRDSRGRYSREYREEDYSREGKGRMVEKLEDLMQEAGSEKERSAIRRLMSQME